MSGDAEDTSHPVHTMVKKFNKNRSSLYMVLSRMKVNENGSDGQNDPLKRAISTGQVGLAMTMIEQECFISSSHLIEAIRKDFQKIVKSLIASGVDVNGSDLKDENGETCSRSSPLYKAVEEDKVECVRLLLEAGAEVDKESGANGWTPLQRASMLSNIPIAKILVEHGADPNKKAPEGWTSLQLIRNKRSTVKREYLRNLCKPAKVNRV